jgi:hypothetical protein
MEREAQENWLIGVLFGDHVKLRIPLFPFKSNRSMMIFELEIILHHLSPTWSQGN